MGYVIGMDGGGTKTRLKLADHLGSLLYTAQGGPSNIYGSSTELVRENYRRLLEEALDALGMTMESIDCLCLGSAGAGREHEQRFFLGLLKELGVSCPIIVADDAITALYGALGKGEGLILIAGTGSICYGRRSNGAWQRSGGWGHILGDEGSGYDIGRRILSEVMRAFDGRAPSTCLTTMVLDKLGIQQPDEMIPLIYREKFNKSDVAAFAVFLDSACEQGDLSALQIMKQAAAELFLCVKAVIEGLAFDPSTCELVLQGSVLERGTCVKEALVPLIMDAYPGIDVKQPLEDAAWGAVLMALEHCRNQ